MYSTPTTRNTVNDASTVRLRVPLTLSLMICGVRAGFLPRTSLIRSNTTIVSLTENPISVSSAATAARSILKSCSNRNCPNAVSWT